MNALENSSPEQVGPNPTLLNNIQTFSRFAPTMGATTLAICRSVFVPAFLLFVIWQLQPAFDATTLRGAIVNSLRCIIPLLFFGLMLQKLLRHNGVAESFYGWSPVLTDGILKTVSKLVLFCIPLKFFYVALETFQGGVFYDSLGRILFVISMAILAIGLWGTAKAIARWRDSDVAVESWTGWLRSVAMTGVAATPAALAVMAAFGYHFTAVQLSGRFITTFLVIVGVAIFTGFVSRLLLITQFRIKLRQLNRNAEGEIEEDESIDISAISAQVNRLLRAMALVAIALVGWQVWSNVLPAIGYLDQYRIWQSAIGDDGVRGWITLRHLLMAAGVISITFVLSRNLPGLLEITLLDRLPLDKGGRYAISFVLRYVVGIIGTLIAFQILGFSWTSVSWLAAGLTLGLGFGLQEIFANLVSGIIILIERPVRVGDLVTVNGVTGTVTRMQLRATTIKDLDYRELIVPNKKFITEDVMNWTLTDRLSRLVFAVGIAYGSDTKLAEKTLLEVARKCPEVMNDPAPQVVFQNFGDSTLNFELRIVIPSREQFAEVRHKLNMMIDEAFREAEIEIAFPQQDVHVKGLESVSKTPSPEGDDDPGRDKERASARKASVVSFSRKKKESDGDPGIAFATQDQRSLARRYSEQLQANRKGPVSDAKPHVVFGKRAA